MDSRELINVLKTFQEKGLECSIATGMFAVNFPDRKLRVFSLEEIQGLYRQVSQSQDVLFFLKETN